MKIIAFNQLRNELSKGNLENWFKSVSFCDYIYIYDQNSDDDSKEFYKKFPNVTVIESTINDFANELICKQKLLDLVLRDHPDVDWIFSIDGDIILDGRICSCPQIVYNLCNVYNKIDFPGLDALAFGHYNLWRSNTYYRVDNMFHYINENGLPILWRNNGNLKFDLSSGLHKPQYPITIKNIQRVGYSLLHRGFATDRQILEKVKLYRSMPVSEWPKGFEHKKYTLWRFMHEEQLIVGKIPSYLAPEWYDINNDICPLDKKSLISLYGEFV